MKLFTFVLLLSIQMYTHACTCLYGSLKDGYNGSDIIFVGKVIYKPEFFSPDAYKFSVSKVFKGKQDSTVFVYTGWGGGDCGFQFEKDQTYLVYAYKNSEEEYLTNICTRTSIISKAGNDLEFLNRLPGSLNATGIAGQLFLYSNNTLRSDNLPVLKNYPVRFESASYSFNVKTDSNGLFYQDNIPSGIYTIIPDENSPLVIMQGIYSYDTTVTVVDNKIAERHIILSEPNIISGLLIDSEGRPLEEEVDLIPEQWYKDKEEKYFYTTYDSYPDSTGRFKFVNIPDGKYYIGVNLEYGPSYYSPYPSTFHNDAKDVASAELLEVKQGSQISDVTIKVSDSIKYYKVRCKVETPDSTLLDRIEMGLYKTPKGQYDENLERGSRYSKNTWEMYIMENTEGWLVFNIGNTVQNRAKGLIPKTPKPIRIEANRNYPDFIITIEMEKGQPGK